MKVKYIIFILLMLFLVACSTNTNLSEEKILQLGYLPTNITEDELFDENCNMQECIEYEAKFYCY